MYDVKAVAEWADYAARCVAANGFDGIMLDMEAIPNGATAPMRPAITAAVCTLKGALKKALPGGVLFWSADTVSEHARALRGPSQIMIKT